MQNLTIVAVHGTFATNAPWTQPNSSFAKQLQDEIGAQQINWHDYAWTGSNSHTAREAAVAGLAEKLKELSANENNIHLVCHSHGGNVGLMTLTSHPSLAKTVRSITCLSTPFFKAEPRDIDHLFDTVQHVLSLKFIVLMTLLYFILLERFSSNIPSLFQIGTTFYLIVFSGAVITAIAVKRQRHRFSQQDLLQRYDYSRVTQPILAIRTSYDEAFYLLILNAITGQLPVIFSLLVGLVALIAYPLFLVTLPLLFLFGILGPLIYLCAQGLRYLVRSPPWSMGESFAHSVLVHFATENRLNHVNAKNVEVPVAISDTHRKFKLRHSALYSSDAAAKEIGAFILKTNRNESIRALVGYLPKFANTAVLISATGVSRPSSASRQSILRRCVAAATLALSLRWRTAFLSARFVRKR